MLGKSQQILANETLQQGRDLILSPTATPISPAFFTDNFSLFVLMVRVAGTVTGTTPALLFAVQQSNDQVTWAQVGSALANITAAGVQVTPYAGTITQTWWRVVASFPSGTGAVFPGVYADMVAQIV